MDVGFQAPVHLQGVTIGNNLYLH